MTENIKQLSIFLKSKEDWTDLHQLLETKIIELYPNTLVVPMPSDDFPKYKSIIETNKFKFIDKPNVKMYKMIEKRCHDNAFILKQLGIIDKIGYGYALSENGCRWREHSWGLKVIQLLKLLLEDKFICN